MHVEDILRGLERGIEATIETPYDATPFYGERIDEFHRSQLIPIPLWHAISADYLGCKPLTNDTNPPCTVNFAKTSDFLILHTSAKIVTQATQEKTSTIYSSSRNARKNNVPAFGMSIALLVFAVISLPAWILIYALTARPDWISHSRREQRISNDDSRHEPNDSTHFSESVSLAHRDPQVGLVVSGIKDIVNDNTSSSNGPRNEAIHEEQDS